MASESETTAANALAELLRNLPGPEDVTNAGLTPVVYKDHLSNIVMVTVNGTEFAAVIREAD